jgi:hypothetical protein
MSINKQLIQKLVDDAKERATRDKTRHDAQRDLELQQSLSTGKPIDVSDARWSSINSNISWQPGSTLVYPYVPASNNLISTDGTVIVGESNGYNSISSIGSAPVMTKTYLYPMHLVTWEELPYLIAFIKELAGVVDVSVTNNKPVELVIHSISSVDINLLNNIIVAVCDDYVSSLD